MRAGGSWSNSTFKTHVFSLRGFDGRLLALVTVIDGGDVGVERGERGSELLFKAGAHILPGIVSFAAISRCTSDPVSISFVSEAEYTSRAHKSISGDRSVSVSLRNCTPTDLTTCWVNYDGIESVS